MKDLRNIKIAVAGTGYVGLSLSVLLSQKFDVVAVDIVKEKVDLVVNGGPDSVLKIFSKIYHSKNINKTIEMIKKH